jgi:hypothetical protein
MTTEPSTTEERETRPVEYMGRTWTAVMPAPEQLLVWQRTLQRLSGETMEGWDGARVLQALDRIRKIIDSVLSPADIEYLDDQMLMGQFKLEQAHDLMMLVIKAFKVNNREERRAAERPAARRAPAKKAAPAKTTRRKTA